MPITQFPHGPHNKTENFEYLTGKLCSIISKRCHCSPRSSGMESSLFARFISENLVVSLKIIASIKALITC